jgi:hypothetical protein
MSEATRIAALKAAVEFRAGVTTPADTLALAKTFDEFLTTGDLPKEPKKSLAAKAKDLVSGKAA